MNNEHKDDNHSTEQAKKHESEQGTGSNSDSAAKDRFEEMGQQAGAVFGQLFNAAEQFGKQMTKETQAWSESQVSQEPFVSALRRAGEEFRTAAGQAAENLSNSVGNSQTSADSDEFEARTESQQKSTSDGQSSTGSARKIGGGSVSSDSQASSAASSSIDAGSRQNASESVMRAEQRAAKLAEIYLDDSGLSELTDSEFEALRKLLEEQYHSLRAFQNTGG